MGITHEKKTYKECTSAEKCHFKSWFQILETISGGFKYRENKVIFTCSLHTLVDFVIFVSLP